MHMLAVGTMAFLLLAAPQAGRRQPPDGSSRIKAVSVPIPPPDRPVPELVQALESPDAAVRAHAAMQLRGAKAIAKNAATRLRELQRDDPDEGVRLAATRAIGLLEVAGVVPVDARWIAENPIPTHTARPEFPDEAWSKKLYGSVKLFVVIDKRGEVRHAEVVESIPDFDAAALDSAWKWRFTPTRALGGQAIPYSLLMPVSFRIY